jgi:Membrane proteins related to metalloendopeptidases
MEDLEMIRRRILNKKSKKKKQVLNDYHFNYVYKFIIRAMVLLMVILSLITIDRINPEKKFLSGLVNQQIDFSKTTKWINTQFLNLIPNFSREKISDTVSSTIYYQHLADNYYKKDDNAITAVNSGTVVFVGNQEILGNYIIVQQSNGVKVVYGNIVNLNVGLYDVLNKNDIIGSYENQILMVFEFEGKEISYEETLFID